MVAQLNEQPVEGQMDVVTAEQFLLDQVPLRYRALFPSVLRNAYAAASALAKAEPILQVPSAKDNHGRLVSWAVDLAFQRLIESGRWAAEYEWKPFSKPTGRYLQIRLSHSRLSISQVSEAAVQPRDVKFRQNARLNNQPSFKLKEFDDTRTFAGLPSFLLVHGRQVREDLEYEFAHLGVPNPVHKRNYIYQTGNLMEMAHTVEAEVPPVEQTDAEAAVSLKEVESLKEEIEKWRRDNGID